MLSCRTVSCERCSEFRLQAESRSIDECRVNAELRTKPRRRFALPAHSKCLLVLLLLTAYCLLLTGCRRDMQDQPKAIAYRESTFFKDGISARPPVEGTVARGFLRADREFYFGKKSGYRTGSGSDRIADATGQQPGAPGATTMFPDDVDTFPFSITKEALDQGQERYNIFCSSCHGLTGNGDGMIARRGFNKPAPASFHQDKLRAAPVGHFFDVITNGWGAMPSHAAQVPVEDRWKIIAYVRALQLSQMKQEPR
jgi:mono/diheme cytochrome c family protein